MARAKSRAKPSIVGPKRKKRAEKPKKAKSKTRNVSPASRHAPIEVDVAVEAAAPDIKVSEALILPDCIDSSEAGNIRNMLLKQRGAPLVVDASHVRRVGTQSLQILVAAARTWRADGNAYCLANPSSEFLETIALVGLSRDEFLLEGSVQ